MTISTAISTYRKKAKLSRSELAELIGVDTVDITSYEKGLSTPSMAIISKIAVACDVSTDELLLF